MNGVQMHQAQTRDLESDIELAQSQFESEWRGTSDDNGARLIAAAITAAGIRIQMGLAEVAAFKRGTTNAEG
jgi:hypothetical protein